MVALTQGTSPHNPEAIFAHSTFLFLTFIYAAAVHLVMDHALAEPHDSATILLVVLLIAFIFSDWASRTRLPTLLPEPIRGAVLIGKTGLEITGIYFLVASFIFLLQPENAARILPNYFSAQSAFAVFLLATWVWDWLIILVMKKPDVEPLLRIVLRGNALKSDATKSYLKPLDNWRKRRKDELEAHGKQVAKVIADNPQKWWPTLPYIGRGLLARCPFDSTLEALMQFIANHILYANLVAGLLIACNEVLLSGQPLSSGLGFPVSLSTLTVPRVLAEVVTFSLFFYVALFLGRGRGFLLVGLITLLMLIGRFWLGAPVVLNSFLMSLGSISIIFVVWSGVFAFGKFALGKMGEVVGALAVCFTILFVYASATPRELMIILAIQQVSVNTFLHFATGAASQGTIAEAK